jgi:hypothetical protein
MLLKKASCKSNAKAPLSGAMQAINMRRRKTYPVMRCTVK